MHELSLCQNLCRILEDEAKRQSFTRVRRISLVVGSFACVEPEALRFGFSVASRGTVAEGATLEIETPPGRAWCFDCMTEVELRARLDPCPLCGGQKLRGDEGGTLSIRELEVV